MSTIPIYIIYKITCIITGKSYIGQTSKGIKNRWNRHLYDTKNNSNYYIHRAIRKYGEENFIHEIVFETTNQNIINEKEIEYIAEYDTFKGDGYNMTIGGEGVNGYWLGKTHNKKTLEKMSRKRSGKNNPMYGKRGSKNPLYGIPRLSVTKQKISKANKGKKRSEEVCNQISESKKGKNNPNFKYYYHTPKGIFESSYQTAEKFNMSYSSIRRWCRTYPDKIITNIIISRSIYLQSLPESPLGKTFREIGFWSVESLNILETE